MGFPTHSEWPDFREHPEYHRLLQDMRSHKYGNEETFNKTCHFSANFHGASIHKYLDMEKHKVFMNQIADEGQQKLQVKLLLKLLAFDPNKRISCREAMEDPYFKVTLCFHLNGGNYRQGRSLRKTCSTSVPSRIPREKSSKKRKRRRAEELHREQLQQP